MGATVRFIVVEDDVHVGQLVGLWLEEAGHNYQLVSNGKDFIKAVSRDSFDLIILDWMLPDTSGDKLLAWVREHIDWPVPVIFVTALDTEDDIVRGLTLGADDYITKPVRHKELLARIQAVLRRSHARADAKERLDLPPFQIDSVSHTISMAGNNVELTQKEFELANFLFRNVGRVLSRAHILESVWGQSSDLHTRTVDTHISRLRTKLGLSSESGWRLSAIYNHGYRLEAPADQSL
jgi:two-component system, OmpR family, response regulator RegX3